jgi:site-specific recombinase XerD
LEARHYAPGTLEAIITAVKRLLRHLPAPRQSALTGDLSTAVPQDITEFVLLAQEAGLAPSTINLSLSILAEFFNFLREAELMSVQPVSKRRHRLLAPTTLPKPMSEADLVVFFKAVNSVRDRLLFLIMLRCGLRVSEACALRWDDCDLSASSLRVDDGKGHVDRIAYLSPDVERELKLWRAQCSDTIHLFPSRKAKATHIGRRNVFVMMQKYLREAGVARSYSPHCLRHTFATQLLNAGVTLEVLKELMGHRSIQNTIKYTQLYEATKRRQYDEAMARVERRRVAAIGGGR